MIFKKILYTLNIIYLNVEVNTLKQIISKIKMVRINLCFSTFFYLTIHVKPIVKLLQV